MELEAPRFEESWPELARSLHGVLLRRGVSSWLADDIVQETGMRLLKHWGGIDLDRSIWGLTLTVAQNVLRDEIRCQARRPTQELDIDIPAPRNLEEEVIARVELERVRQGLDQLTDSQRTVLLAEVGGPEDQTSSPAAVKMMRMRARRRLRTVLERASMGVAGIKWRIESEITQMHAALHRNDVTQGTYFMNPAAGVLSALTLVTAALAITDVFDAQAKASPDRTTSPGVGVLYAPDQAAFRMKSPSKELSGFHSFDGSDADSTNRKGPRERNVPGEVPDEGARGLVPVYADAGSEGTHDPTRAERFRLWAATATHLGGHDVGGGFEMILENPDCGSNGCSNAAAPTGSAHAKLDEQHHVVSVGGPVADDEP